MRLLSSLFLFMICLGCKKENHPKIEVYLLKHPVESTEGVLFRETERYKNLDSVEQRWYKDSRGDTLSGEIIYGGKFDATTEDIQSLPFIIDEEIHEFDIKNDIITFDSIVIKRIETHKPSKSQFVITIDKEPVLTGYFWTGFNSRIPSWYTLYGTDSYGLKVTDEKYKRVMLEFGAPKLVTKLKHRRESFDRPRPPYPQELIEALRSTGRLIE